MSGNDKIKKELLAAIKEDRAEYIDKVKEEIEIFDNTEGINQKNNLTSIYECWKDYINDKYIKEEDSNSINSYLLYCLGLTDILPEKESAFLPERRAFARASLPDIDTDFDYFYQSDVQKYILGRYGEGYGANIGTYLTLALRAYVRSAGKALDIADSFSLGQKEYITNNERLVKEINDTLPKTAGKIKIRFQDGTEKEIKTLDEAADYIPEFNYYMQQYPELYEISKDILGLRSNFGVHAAGVCVADVPMETIAALRKSRGDDCKYATQYPHADLESIGIIKFDILALATLTILKETVRLIKENYGIEIDIHNLDLADKKTLDLYRNGETVGVFQVESKGMQDALKQIEVDHFRDIVAVLALYRPGPMKFIPDYAAVKQGHKKADYFHPSIEKHIKPYLEETYGILCYQEQVMFVCNSLAKFSLIESYYVIKAVGKKDKTLLEKYKTRFIQGCFGNSVDKDLAEKYWDNIIIPFADYAFNKSHSASYAVLSHQTAYLKAHFPDEFMTAYLTVETKRRKMDRVSQLEREVKRMKIKIVERDINKSDVHWKIERKKDVDSGILKTEIRPPLVCRGLGEDIAEIIKSNAPYASFDELVFKNPNDFTREHISALFDAGFFSKKNKDGKVIKVYSEKDVDKKEKLLEKFDTLKQDKKELKKRGVVRGSIFSK